MGGPLTSALKQLSQAIDPSPVSHKGMVYRPEYYIQHVDKGMQVKMLDHTKLTYKELVSGMGRVMQYLVENGGDVAGYVGHFNFIAEQAYQHSFVDQAFVGYDRFVVDKYIKLETSNKTPKVFAVGDVLGVASHFHAGNFQSTQKKTSTAYRGSRGSTSIVDSVTTTKKGPRITRKLGCPKDFRRRSVTLGIINLAQENVLKNMSVECVVVITKHLAAKQKTKSNDWKDFVCMLLLMRLMMFPQMIVVRQRRSTQVLSIVLMIVLIKCMILAAVWQRQSVNFLILIQ